MIEMMEAEITIDANVHSEIAVWASGWDNEDSRMKVLSIEEELKKSHPEAKTNISMKKLLQSEAGLGFEKINYTTLFMDFDINKVVVSTRSQYVEENAFRKEIEEALTCLYKDMEDACRLNTRIKIKSRRELKVAV